MKEILAECLNIDPDTIEDWYYKQFVHTETASKWDSEGDYIAVDSIPEEPVYQVITTTGEEFVYLHEIIYKLWETRKK